ncbi:unnamed protein product [Lepeophtheirus salmonis]|uniref:(salmon louse) hypothetical protein n=1 Tax=Lepeophtheirus salmonis TaxID=72036 RepID=A0A817FCZ6_LEPSM|nr:unnamed protein product [Lepeophtheirus salmonis]CAG9477130.1 unnamed protein product [Lepeophtheirus salmonis]
MTNKQALYVEKLDLMAVRDAQRDLVEGTQIVSGVRSFEEASVRWPGNIVEYTFGAGYTNTSVHDMIRAAMDHIEYQTCVKFMKTDGKTKKTTLLINGESQCSSTVGYAGLQEDYWAAILSLNVTTCLQFGIIVHELMHGLGSLHEQSRPDRNEFIQVEWNNIFYWGRNQFYKYYKYGETCPECPKTTNQSLTSTEINTLNSCCDKNQYASVLGGYDYGSIMHYEIRNGFGLKMDIDTMKPLRDVSPEVEIGQRTAMSPLDVEKVNEMFKCPSKKVEKEHDYIRGQWDYCPKSCFRCGQSNFMKTSCGGTNINYTRESKPKEFPWNAYLVKSEGWKSLDCGGVLIKDNIFLFAASCFDGHSVNEKYQIKVGTIFPDYHEARTQYLFLTNITIHPQYNSSTLMNDIAVVKTSFEPVLSDGVVSICLPTNSSHYYKGRAATYTYVNNKTETERTMQVQKFGILKVVSNDGGFQFDANEIVSGPLVMKENGDCTVIGISSKLSVSETNSNISDEIGFTRVDQYLDWIEESIIRTINIKVII